MCPAAAGTAASAAAAVHVEPEGGRGCTCVGVDLEGLPGPNLEHAVQVLSSSVLSEDLGDPSSPTREYHRRSSC